MDADNWNKKSLKIPKGLWETTNGRTDNTLWWKKDKQWSTQHLKENKRLSNTNSTNNRVWTHVLYSGRTGLRLRQTEHICGHFVIQIFLKGLPSHGGDLKIFEMMTTT